MAETDGLVAFAAAMRMIDRIHRGTADGRTASEPAARKYIESCSAVMSHCQIQGSRLC